MNAATYLALVTPEARITVTNARKAAANCGPLPLTGDASGSWLKMMYTKAPNALIWAAWLCMSLYSWLPGLAAAMSANLTTDPLVRWALMLRNRVWPVSRIQTWLAPNSVESQDL